MKNVIIHTLRVLIALFFMFSGIIKLNDPAGFTLKLDEYFQVFSNDFSNNQPKLNIELTENAERVLFVSEYLNPLDSLKKLGIFTTLNVNTKDSNNKALDFEQLSIITVNKIEVAQYKKILKDTSKIFMYSFNTSLGDKNISQKNLSSKSILNRQSEIVINVAPYIVPKSGFSEFCIKLTQWSLYIAIGLCAIEFLLGFALLIGYKLKFTLWSMYILMLLFTGLTAFSYFSAYNPKPIFYIALSCLLLFITCILCFKNGKLKVVLTSIFSVLAIIFISLSIWTNFSFQSVYNSLLLKVTDCGCFGDFLKLTPKISFFKDILLLIILALLLVFGSLIRPWFSSKFGNGLVFTVFLLCISFGVYCYLMLPIWDFLPYKKGNNISKLISYIPKGANVNDSFYITYCLQKGNDSVRIEPQFMKDYENKGFLLKENSRNQIKISEGYKSPVHNFQLYDSKTTQDITMDFLKDSNFKLLWVCSNFEKTPLGDFKAIKPINDWSIKFKIPIYCLQASEINKSTEILMKNKLKMKVINGDPKLLITMARYNSTLYLFKGAKIVQKWSGNFLPSIWNLESKGAGK